MCPPIYFGHAKTFSSRSIEPSRDFLGPIVGYDQLFDGMIFIKILLLLGSLSPDFSKIRLVAFNR